MKSSEIVIWNDNRRGTPRNSAYLCWSITIGVTAILLGGCPAQNADTNGSESAASADTALPITTTPSGSVITASEENPPASTATGTPAPPTPVPPPPPAETFPQTANSIRTADAGVRSDPEQVAAPAQTTKITWKDARGADRSLTLGGYLYQYDFTFSDNRQIVSRSANDDAWGHEGFGYVVSHNTMTGNSPLGKANIPTRVTTRVLEGGHHAIHRVEFLYDRDKEGGGLGLKIPVVIEWLVATGRDHPIWAVTWKAGEIINPGNVDLNTYRMDVRGPYGSLNFDGALNRSAGDAVGGVSWGDFALKFSTTDPQLTLNSPWTYNTPNSVNFTRAWTATTNAEMGIVQTRAGDKQMGYGGRVVGRERGATSAANFTNRGDCSGSGDNRRYTVPCINGWPYQLMNYDWSSAKPAGEPTGTKLMAWGSPYGWLGASSADAFDYSTTFDGRGDRSYATFIVLGPKGRFDAGGALTADGDVTLSIKQVEALSAATIGNVTIGAVATQAPRGPGASQTKALASGYDDTYAAYVVEAANNSVAFTFGPAAGKPVRDPIFIIRNYAAAKVPTITVNGAAVSVNTGATDAGAFVSRDADAHEVWITLNRNVETAINVTVAP